MSTTKKKVFTKDFMLDVLHEETEEIISDDINDTNRWSEFHTLIFKYDGKIYRAYYSRGLTEQQDESPWECDDDVEAELVVAEEYTAIRYVEVQE
jgi:hypothetical protein